jgi:hypothetical protein
LISTGKLFFLSAARQFHFIAARAKSAAAEPARDALPKIAPCIALLVRELHRNTSQHDMYFCHHRFRDIPSSL